MRSVPVHGSGNGKEDGPVSTDDGKQEMELRRVVHWCFDAGREQPLFTHWNSSSGKILAGKGSEKVHFVRSMPVAGVTYS